MEKYKYHMLSIETTRRCNKKCVHCVNGDAQNITMSNEIVDRIFEDVADVRRVHFGGGESLLSIEVIEYFIRKILDSPWTTKMVEVTTNGTILDRRIVDVFELFCAHKPGNFADFRISNDQFHDAAEYERAYSYYKPLVDEANKRIWQNSDNGGILLHYTGDLQHEQLLHYGGRAVELINSGNSQYRHGLNVDYILSMKHRIEIMNGVIPRTLQILANGNICIYEEVSYAELDRLSFGNVKSDTLSNLIEKHNKECLLLRSEAERLHAIEYSRYLPSATAGELSFAKFDGIICNRIMELRKKARELFPYVPAQDIITEIPFPTESKVNEMLCALYENSSYYSAELPANIKKHISTPKEHIYVDALCRAVFAYLRSPSFPVKRPYGVFFGGEEGILPEFVRLRKLNQRYMKNPGKVSNSKIFSRNLNNMLETMTLQEYEEAQDRAVDFFMNTVMGRMKTE